MIDFIRRTAVSDIRGSALYKHISGRVIFEQTDRGVIVSTRVYGLPKGNGRCERGIFGFHIHEGKNCGGDEFEPFKETLGHYNPYNCPHPFHSGDLPPLFECNGFAYLSFLTDRFLVSDIIGKTVVIHSKPDDFTSQPSGNAGEKIACGVIKQIKM